MSVPQAFDKAFRQAFVRLYLLAFEALGPGESVDLALVTSDAADAASEAVGWR